MKTASLGRWCILLLASLLVPLPHVQAQTQRKIVSLGADLTPSQRQALLARFGASEGTDKVLTINTAQMAEAMQNIIPVPPGYTSVSSTALTCGAPGSGLHVTTEHITRVTAGMYAGALLAAGIGDAELVVAAPADAEAEGMTALAGLFKGIEGGACGRDEFDPGRRELAYRWLAVAARLGDALGDQHAAARVVLRAQEALAERGGDPSAAEQALNRASEETGTTVPPDQREPVLDLLRRTAEAKIDWGTYATGWDLQEIHPHEVRLAASGVAPGAGGGSTLTGKVRTAMGPETPLTIDVVGQPRQLNLNASNVVVTRDDRPAQLSDIRAGDTVTIHVGPDYVAERIDARSSLAAKGASGRFVVGTVDDNNEGQLTLATAEGRQQFAVPRSAYILRDGREAQLGAVTAQDSAVLALDPAGQVLAVFARPGGGDYAVEGTVRAPLSGRRLEVATGSQAIGVAVPTDSVKVSRNGRTARLDDIQPNDRVTVRFNALSQPVAIDASSSRGLLDNLRNSYLPLLLLLLVLVLLLLLGRRRFERVLLVLPGRRRRIVDPDDIDGLRST